MLQYSFDPIIYLPLLFFQNINLCPNNVLSFLGSIKNSFIKEPTKFFGFHS